MRRTCQITESCPPLTLIETLIEARWVIPVEPSGTMLTDHSVAVDSGHIAAILPTEEARRRLWRSVTTGSATSRRGWIYRGAL